MFQWGLILGAILGAGIVLGLIMLFKPIRLWASRQVVGRDSVKETQV